MFREMIHIDQIKSFAEEAFNGWLSYTMAQPVYFDIAIIACFALQYFGVREMLNLSSRLRGLSAETADLNANG